jgi:hypothetical protein
VNKRELLSRLKEFKPDATIVVEIDGVEFLVEAVWRRTARRETYPVLQGRPLNP